MGVALAAAAVAFGPNAFTAPSSRDQVASLSATQPAKAPRVRAPATAPYKIASVAPSLPGIPVHTTSAHRPAVDLGSPRAGASEWFNHFSRPAPIFAVLDVDNSRFASASSGDASASRKLAMLFTRAKARAEGTTSRVAAVEPAPERFQAVPVSAEISARIALAYADPSPAPTTGALAAISAMAPVDEGALALANPDDDASDEDLLIPDDGTFSEEDLPDDGPLPNARPRHQARPQVEEPETPGPRVSRGKGTKREQLAYARPENPIGDRPNAGIGRALKNLFGGARAGKGVAVYDISAARVYMPDGTTLEAHSGIGKMADNPRYTHVKMNGATPPHTYNLKMRESRFHGVEAIRMLPVDGKNPHGRTGLLTHSYLLRGGRAESHGCVAFKDYKRFLAAFKKGHVKQLVVVSSGGRGTLVAQNGRRT